jgi:hypothetical protein
VCAAAATKLLLGVVVLLPPSAAAKPVEFARGTIDQAPTSDRPGTPTGTRFSARYHAAGDRDAPPPYMRKMTFHPHAGWRWDTSVPERCTASDLELAASGAAACPEGSRIGGGSADFLFMRSFPTTVEIDAFNNTGEQIMLARSPVLTTVVRARFQPDGSLEFDRPPMCYPSTAGCPVDNSVQVASRIALGPYTRPSGGTVRSYMTTPAKCPKSRRWTSQIRIWWADGSVDTIVIKQPCKRPAPKRRKRSARRG